MKWFQHLTDAHSDLKIEKMLISLGFEAYGVFWACVELVGKYGKNYRLRADEGWFEKLQRMGKCSDLKMILDRLSEENLINQEAYKKGDLYTPKLKNFGDEYTRRKTTFTPPLLEEIEVYCDERNNKIDPESFLNFYSSKGWFVGKNKMKDWRAAVRTWEKRKREDSQGQGGLTVKV